IFQLSGNIAIDKGSVSLKALKAASIDAALFGQYRTDIGLAKEVILTDSAGKQIHILADVIVQNSGSLNVAEGAKLQLISDVGGSASLMQAGNNFAGSLSTSLAGGTTTGAADEGSIKSLLRVSGKQINIGDSGVQADVVYLAADQLATTGTASITARLGYSNSIGIRTQLPAMVLDIGLTAFDGVIPSPFGTLNSNNIRVSIGSTSVNGTGTGTAAVAGAVTGEAGYLTLRPKLSIDPVKTGALINKRAAIFTTLLLLFVSVNTALPFSSSPSATMLAPAAWVTVPVDSSVRLLA
ncbi:hypothetical protein ACVBEH_23110, partial [Roseateles sp. GG27B]